MADPSLVREVVKGPLSDVLRAKLREIEPHKGRGSTEAEADVELLQSLLRSWTAYQEDKQKECVEAYAASVQHDSPLQLHPSSDPAYYKFLVTALSEAQELGVPAEAAAAATAYLCVSDPKVLGLKDEDAGARLGAIAAAVRSNWWIQYAHATWFARHKDQKQAAEALTRAILAGGPPGMYYSRGRVFSYLEKTEQSARDFKKFLELAPPEHRARPDALYALALDAAMQRDLAAARQLFAQGEAAEAQVTPWAPYTGSEVKMTVQLLLTFGAGGS